MPYKDPEKRRAQDKIRSKGRYSANREKLCESQRKRRHANAEQYRMVNAEDNRRARKLNPEKYRIAVKRWQDAHPVHVWAQKSLRRHERLGFAVSVTIEELVNLASRTNFCPYCGVALDFASGKGIVRPNSPTVDRVNSEATMRLDNIQIICHACNSAKGKTPHAEFIASLGKGE
jgi:hypothetical protein